MGMCGYRLLIDALNRALPVDWTSTVQGGRGTRGSMPVYSKPAWSQGFDIVIRRSLGLYWSSNLPASGRRRLSGRA
jgi:hypothetical protein